MFSMLYAYFSPFCFESRILVMIVQVLGHWLSFNLYDDDDDDYNLIKSQSLVFISNHIHVRPINRQFFIGSY